MGPRFNHHQHHHSAPVFRYAIHAQYNTSVHCTQTSLSPLDGYIYILPFSPIFAPPSMESLHLKSWFRVGEIWGNSPYQTRTMRTQRPIILDCVPRETEKHDECRQHHRRLAGWRGTGLGLGLGAVSTCPGRACADSMHGINIHHVLAQW